jgi:hypothetical protein
MTLTGLQKKAAGAKYISFSFCHALHTVSILGIFSLAWCMRKLHKLCDITSSLVPTNRRKEEKLICNLKKKENNQKLIY